MMKTLLVLVSAVVALAWAQGGIPVSCFPDETKVAFIQNTLCKGPRDLIRLCRFNTPGVPPVSCKCSGEKSPAPSFKVAEVAKRDLSTFKDAWDLWLCRPNECTCSDGKNVKIPGVPDLKEEDLPVELEQKHLLCDALKTLPCKRRGARQADPACTNLQARPPKTVDPRCPSGK